MTEMQTREATIFPGLGGIQLTWTHEGHQMTRGHETVCQCALQRPAWQQRIVGRELHMERQRNLICVWGQRSKDEGISRQ